MRSAKKPAYLFQKAPRRNGILRGKILASKFDAVSFHNTNSVA
ncbi:hypothetical protein CAMGR0001_0971 [Campylobacter gracilis RM3268]|uniref:Uncharacterized protein n=1 Tax=Campylobacter gracilis RM3268 TaxID=553220 RepID=C8PGH6_9BACT|nr:hypothetical protein CAMGR0001_0971 [Campylobacter gracilis RM3268]